MSNLYLTVKFHGGTHIDDACKEACALANKLGITIDFKFNDVTCMAHVGTDPEDLARNWHTALHSTFTHKFASGTRRLRTEAGGEHG